MVKFVGDNKANESRRIMEGNLKPFLNEMRTAINRMLRDGHPFKMEDQSEARLLQARKELANEIKTLYAGEDREAEIAVKALAVWYRRKEMEQREAEEGE